MNKLQLAILVFTAVGTFLAGSQGDFVSLGLSDTLIKIVSSAITATIGLLAAVKSGEPASPPVA